MTDPTRSGKTSEKRSNAPPPSVFISYRTGQSTGSAILLFELLRRRLPDVFRDKNCLNYGENWPDRLESAVKQCWAVVVVIGKGWTEEFEIRAARAREAVEKGEKPEVDWVKREIQLALQNKTTVIPVAEAAVAMPSAKDLPDGFETFPVKHGGQIHPEHYQKTIESIFKAVWQWPPWLYWINCALLFAMTILWALWGLFPWWLAGVPFLIVNVIALSGKQYGLLPGGPWLRGIFSRGTTVAALLVAVLPPFLATRVEVGCVDCLDAAPFTLRDSAGAIIYAGSARRAQDDWTWFARPAANDLFLWRDGYFLAAIRAAGGAFDRRHIDAGRDVMHKAVIIEADPASWNGQWGGQQYLRLAFVNGSDRVLEWESPSVYRGQPVGFGARVEGGFINPLIEALAANAEVDISFAVRGYAQDSVQAYRTRRRIGFRAGQPAKVVFSR